ncbi:MAG TPA: secretin and TonB N-terminal domain-containing protein [Thermoanaerobaculia bacterium]|nr:secretin and TonB N-terminal domain-containing protein [Thermoanaerobaculia bacterium]
MSSLRHLRRAAAVVALVALLGPGAGSLAEAPPARPAPASDSEVEAPFPGPTIVVHAEPAAPAAREPSGETISLSLREADLVEVLRSFARLGGFNLVVDPRVQGTVTVELRDVRWQLALAVILRTHGLAAEIDGRIVSIRPLPVRGG